MIQFRLTTKLFRKIKEKPNTDIGDLEGQLKSWHSTLFMSGRYQYILFSNSTTLYSFMVSGRGITNKNTYFEAFLQNLKYQLTNDFLFGFYDRLIPNKSEEIDFLKTKNKSILGSIGDFVQLIKYDITDKNADILDAASFLKPSV